MAQSDSASDDERPSRRQRGWSRLKDKLGSLTTKKDPYGSPEDAEQDLESFLRPGLSPDRLTHQAPAPTSMSARMNQMAPKLDIDAAKPYYSTGGQKRVPQDNYDQMERWRPLKPPRQRGLTVAFSTFAPEVIGHGGDATEEPPAFISRTPRVPAPAPGQLRAMPPQVTTQGRPAVPIPHPPQPGPMQHSIPDRSREVPFTAPAMPPPPPVPDDSNFVPKPMKRVQTGFEHNVKTPHDFSVPTSAYTTPVTPSSAQSSSAASNRTAATPLSAGAPVRPDDYRFHLEAPAERAPQQSARYPPDEEDQNRSLRYMAADEGLTLRTRRTSPSPFDPDRRKLETNPPQLADRYSSLRPPSRQGEGSRSGSPYSLRSRSTNSPDPEHLDYTSQIPQPMIDPHKAPATSTDDTTAYNRSFMAQITGTRPPPPREPVREDSLTKFQQVVQDAQQQHWKGLPVEASNPGEHRQKTIPQQTLATEARGSVPQPQMQSQTDHHATGTTATSYSQRTATQLPPPIPPIQQRGQNSQFDAQQTPQATQSTSPPRTDEVHPQLSEKDAAFQTFTHLISPALHYYAQQTHASARQPTSIEWLRSAYWWFLSGRTGLESYVRRRYAAAHGRIPPSSSTIDPLSASSTPHAITSPETPTSPQEDLAQHHADLAKSWFIVSTVLSGSPETLGLRTDLVDGLRALAASMAKRDVLPPSPFTFPPNINPALWLSYPSLAPETAFVLGGGSSALAADIGMPLTGVSSRCFVGVTLLDADEEAVSPVMPCLMSVLRPPTNNPSSSSSPSNPSPSVTHGSHEPTLLLRSQTPLVAVNVLPAGQRGVTWEHVHFQDEGWIRIKLPRKLRVKVDLSEREFRALRATVLGEMI